MAKTIELKMAEGYIQPVVEINGIPALISPGVAVPVFSLPQNILKELYGAKVVSTKHHTMGGMSGKLEGDILQLKDFRMGELNFPVLDVFCPQEPIKQFPLIISNTMLYDLSYSFDTAARQFIIEIPDAEPLNRTVTFEIVQDKIVNVQLNNKPLLESPINTNEALGTL